MICTVNKMTSICFVGNPNDSFIKEDYVRLKKTFEINAVDPPRKLEVSKWIKFLRILIKNVRKSDITYCWFAGAPAACAVFFSNVFRKKSIVMVGGWDASYFPEINYGAFLKFKDRMPVKFVYRHVAKILVVAPFLKDDIIKYAKIKGDSIEFVPTGFDPDYWTPCEKKENIIITVAGAKTLLNVKIKGLETFVRSAAYLPEIQFIAINVKDEAKEYLQKISSNNVVFTGFLPDNEILNYYQKAKVYCQLSYREGLPTALCEAMLCECIPVGSNAAGVMTAIGDTGFYVEYGDEKETADMIRKALDSTNELGKKARERIKNSFPEEKRTETLKKLFSEMANSS
jgi:glycosyltransferase involved in cell wall biosynthesis